MRRWTLQQALRRAAEVLRQEGIKSLWFKPLGETIYRREVLMERLLDEPIIEVTPRYLVRRICESGYFGRPGRQEMIRWSKR